MAFYERRERPFDWFRTEDLAFFPHTHGHGELILVGEGDITITVGEHARKLLPGQMAIVFPNAIHSYHTDHHSVCELLIFDTELAGEFAQQLARYQPHCPFLRAEDVHEDALRAMWALRDGLTPPLLHGYLLVLLGRVLERMELQKKPAPLSEDLLQRLLIYLDEHFREPLNLDSIAAQLGVSRYQISRCFSQQIGCNFNSYLNALRTSCAAGLLRHGGISIAEAGYASGFDSLSTFYRAFKQDRGISPKAYLQQIRGN